MRCGHVRKAVLEGDEISSAGIREHLRGCSECAAYLQQWERVRGGLKLLVAEQPPDPSCGFAQRVTRNLQDPSLAGRVLDLSLMRAGRRFVYAALTAVLLLVLGVLVPASGPVRSPAATIEAAQPETVAAQNYPIYSGRLMDNEVEFAPPSGNR